MDLSQFEDDPDRLARFGFVRREQATTDVVRLVWFEHRIGSSDSGVQLTVQVQFEVVLTDEPRPGPSCSYSFDGVFLHVAIADVDLWAFDDDPDSDARVPLQLTRLQDVQRLIQLLRPSLP